MYFQDLILALQKFLGGARLPHRAAVQLRGRRRHVQPGHVPARDRAGAVERRVRRALAAPDRRPLRRQPEPPAAVSPVPGDPQAEPARHPGSVPRELARARHQSAGARRPLHRGRLGVPDARRVGPRLAGVARRARDQPVHLLPAGRRLRLQAGERASSPTASSASRCTCRTSTASTTSRTTRTSSTARSAQARRVGVEHVQLRGSGRGGALRGVRSRRERGQAAARARDGSAEEARPAGVRLRRARRRTRSTCSTRAARLA